MARKRKIKAEKIYSAHPSTPVDEFIVMQQSIEESIQTSIEKCIHMELLSLHPSINDQIIECKNKLILLLAEVERVLKDNYTLLLERQFSIIKKYPEVLSTSESELKKWSEELFLMDEERCHIRYRSHSSSGVADPERDFNREFYNGDPERLGF